MYGKMMRSFMGVLDEDEEDAQEIYSRKGLIGLPSMHVGD